MKGVELDLDLKIWDWRGHGRETHSFHTNLMTPAKFCWLVGVETTTREMEKEWQGEYSGLYGAVLSSICPPRS